MNFKITKLLLQCRQSEEVISFSETLNFFHGRVSTGKSSIARLIDFCLGGDLVKTPAINEEMISATLQATVGEYDVIFERTKGTNQIQVTWKKDEDGYSTLVPIDRPAENSLVEDAEIYNFSDLLYYLTGVSPIKVRQRKKEPDSRLIRLGFRALMTFCYLVQKDLDSSFYRLETPVVKEQSKDALNFVVGKHSEELTELDIELDNTLLERNSKQEAAKKLNEFLEGFGYHSEEKIKKQIESENKTLQAATVQRTEMLNEYKTDTHVADDLRNCLRSLGRGESFEHQPGHGDVNVALAA